MGFFSWQCAKTKKPVMAQCGVVNTPWSFASDVIVLFRNGDRISGSYDGYGRVGGYELTEIPEGRWRMVISRYYEGESFEELAENTWDPGQGYFYDDADLEDKFGKP